MSQPTEAPPRSIGQLLSDMAWERHVVNDLRHQMEVTIPQTIAAKEESIRRDEEEALRRLLAQDILTFVVQVDSNHYRIYRVVDGKTLQAEDIHQ